VGCSRSRIWTTGGPRAAAEQRHVQRRCNATRDSRVATRTALGREQRSRGRVLSHTLQRPILEQSRLFLLQELHLDLSILLCEQDSHTVLRVSDHLIAGQVEGHLRLYAAILPMSGSAPVNRSSVRKSFGVRVGHMIPERVPSKVLVAEGTPEPLRPGVWNSPWISRTGQVPIQVVPVTRFPPKF